MTTKDEFTRSPNKEKDRKKIAKRREQGQYALGKLVQEAPQREAVFNSNSGVVKTGGGGMVERLGKYHTVMSVINRCLYKLER